MGLASSLLDRHAFVDLETTGLDPESDEVIELGVLFVERGEATRRISRLFSARAPLPLAIQRITGLTAADLAGQPAFAEAVPELRAALAGWTVVAHNAAFEQAFLGPVLGEAGAAVLDSCELLHYLYPELESHALESAIRWAGVGDRASHRALKDCEDTWAVLAHALERGAAEGRTEDLADLLDTLEPRWSEPGHAPSSPLAALLSGLHALARTLPAPFALTPSTPFLPGKPERERHGPPPPRVDLDATPRPVTEEEVAAVLGPSGSLERAVPGFTSRPGQVAMAQAVARTLAEGGALAVEAGTGTGKSLAYLAPAALFAARNGRKVAIAPHTRTLQDQLIEKDLPRLHHATGGAFQYAVLKGQTNYLCRRRALEATAVRPAMGHSERAPRAYLRAFLRRSPDGDLDRLSYWFREHYPALGSLVVAARSESATTLGEKCPHYTRCYYHSAVAQAKAADLLVVNQSLALAWPARYPRVDEWILDEAHELEDVATSALAREVTDRTLERVGDRLLGRAGQGGLAREVRRGVGSAGKKAARAYAAQVEEQCRALLEAGDALQAQVAALCEAGQPGDDAGFGRERRIDAAVRAGPEWPPFEKALGAAALAADGLYRTVSTGAEEAFPELEALRPALERDLNGAAAELLELATLLEQLWRSPEPNTCYAAQLRPGGRGFNLAALPVDVGPAFQEQFARKKRALVLTSATLSAGEPAPWVLERLGLTAGAGPLAPRVMRAPSPFDLARQALVVLVTDAPRTQDDAFVEWAAARIAGLARFMGGRVLGLFASTRRLERVGERVRAQLEPAGIEVMRQSRGHGRTLAARQERDTGTVLLGTRSFWQGVDIPGLGVGLVFIDKLPLEPQTRPIVAAREERFAGAGGYAGFAKYRLPRALLLLRQGVGRLIRSSEDRGVVLIADPGSPRYRAEVLAALEGYPVVALPWAEARVRIDRALLELGLAATPAGSAASPPARAAPAPAATPPAPPARPAR